MSDTTFVFVRVEVDTTGDLEWTSFADVVSVAADPTFVPSKAINTANRGAVTQQPR